MTRISLSFRAGERLARSFLPQFLLERTIVSATWRGEMDATLSEDFPRHPRSEYLAVLTLRQPAEVLICEASFRPASAPPRVEHSFDAYLGFAQKHGAFEYVHMPNWLHGVDCDLSYPLRIPGRPRHRDYDWTKHAGPWEILPRERINDWRIRARQTLGPRLASSQLLEVIHVINVAGLYREARLAIDYHR